MSEGEALDPRTLPSRIVASKRQRYLWALERLGRSYPIARKDITAYVDELLAERAEELLAE